MAGIAKCSKTQLLPNRYRLWKYCEEKDEEKKRWRRLVNYPINSKTTTSVREHNIIN